MTLTYIYLAGQIVGNQEHGFEVIYNWDRKQFSNREDAIKHGLRNRGSDDFNIGVFDGDKLVSLDWMDKIVSRDPAEMARIQKDNNLTIEPFT